MSEKQYLLLKQNWSCIWKEIPEKEKSKIRRKTKEAFQKVGKGIVQGVYWITLNSQEAYLCERYGGKTFWNVWETKAVQR